MVEVMVSSGSLYLRHSHLHLPFSANEWSGYKHTLLLVGRKGYEVIVTFVFTDLGTLGKDGVTSGREGRRSWSHVSYIMWEERQ